jgi:hypothetical protein
VRSLSQKSVSTVYRPEVLKQNGLLRRSLLSMNCNKADCTQEDRRNFLHGGVEVVCIKPSCPARSGDEKIGNRVGNKQA